MGQQNSCKTLTWVHSTMHLMHSNEGHATITCIHVHNDTKGSPFSYIHVHACARPLCTCMCTCIGGVICNPFEVGGFSCTGWLLSEKFVVCVSVCVHVFGVVEGSVLASSGSICLGITSTLIFL